VIKRRIEPLEVALGHLAKFTCEIQGAPNVRFQWFKAGREIYESDKCSIRSSNYVSSLEILRTQVVDCGEYTCKASNEYGSVSCTATLTVTGKCHTPTGMPPPYHVCCFSYRFGKCHQLGILTSSMVVSC
jgi:titin